MGLLCYLFFILPRWLEAQHAAPLLAFPKLNGELNTHVIRPYKFSIFNSPFSIVHCFGLRSVSLELLVLFFQEKRTRKHQYIIKTESTGHSLPTVIKPCFCEFRAWSINRIIRNLFISRHKYGE